MTHKPADIFSKIKATHYRIKKGLKTGAIMHGADRQNQAIIRTKAVQMIKLRLSDLR